MCAYLETQKMLCAVDQARLEHYPLSPFSSSAPFSVPLHLHEKFDLLAMQSSPSPPSEKSHSIKNFGYFFTPTVSTSGRQRTAQACDKCRERKTKVGFLSSYLTTDSEFGFASSAPVKSLYVSGAPIEVSFANTPTERPVCVGLPGLECCLLRPRLQQETNCRSHIQHQPSLLAKTPTIHGPRHHAGTISPWNTP
jgi:hypothetical protein